MGTIPNVELFQILAQCPTCSNLVILVLQWPLTGKGCFLSFLGTCHVGVPAMVKETDTSRAHQNVPSREQVPCPSCSLLYPLPTTVPGTQNIHLLVGADKEKRSFTIPSTHTFGGARNWGWARLSVSTLHLISGIFYLPVNQALSNFSHIQATSPFLLSFCLWDKLIHFFTYIN